MRTSHRMIRKMILDRKSKITDEELREVAEPIALERCRSRKFEDLKKSITRMIGEAQDVDALRMYVKIGIDLIDLLEESD